VEAAARYEPAKWLAFDFKASALHARYADGAAEYVPGAAERNASASATMLLPAGWSAGLSVNYLGKRAGSDEVPSLRDSTFVNARFTRQLGKDTHVAVDLFNLFDQKLRDVDYFSASRLPDSGAEPRGLRLRIRTTF
jgi:outer membrane receptor protein involved in Fe transport